MAKEGFVSLYELSIRVVTRKNVKIDFELFAVNDQAIERVSIQGQRAEAYASASEFASFSVRGRGPRDNLLFVDDFPFDKAIHFDATLGEEEDVGGGGRFSIFAPNVISGAEFSPGGWGAACLVMAACASPAHCFQNIVH